jgi:predicted dehydrogenase
MWAPKVDQVEALKLEAEHFNDCIINDRQPINDGLSGLTVVRMLEAACKSIKKKGEMVYL